MRLKEVVIRAAKSLGGLALVRDSRWRRHRLLILCYHGVAMEDEHEWDPALYITQEQLRGRLRILRDGGYTILPLAEATHRLYEGTLPPRSVAITFDDGAVDFERRALPVLREFNAPATLYLTTYYCITRLPVFNTVLSYVLWKGRDSGGDVSSLCDSPIPLPVVTDVDRAQARGLLYEYTLTRQMDAREKDKLVSGVAAALGVDYAAIVAKGILQIMPPDVVRELPGDLVDIQLHTHRHRTPRDREQFIQEVRDNVAVTRELRGESPALEHFCYPSGDYAGEFLAWLRECNVRYATTCVPDLASISVDPLLLPRFVDTSHQSDLAFEAWASGFAGLLPHRREFRLDHARLQSPEARLTMPDLAQLELHAKRDEPVIVVEGNAARRLLQSASFREAWATLHAECSWATVFQSVPFVTTWYRVYDERYDPIILYCRRVGGSLGGLLVLARDRETGAVVNAGTMHAEYHSWLATRENLATFPVAALEALRGWVHSGSLTFLFLSPGTPLDWVMEAEAKGLRMSIRWHDRGLVQLGPGSDVLASLRKSSNKSRIARLRRIGPVTFEQVHTADEFRTIIDTIATQCDVRQGGRSANLPFRTDSHKAAFYTACMEEAGLTHATVLKAGNHIIATHVGFVDRIPALGLITHGPEYGEHSPGKLLLLYLHKLLGEQGYTEFDMTPGRPYKKRFATHKDAVCVLEVFFDKAAHRRYQTRAAAAKAGHWVSSVTGSDIKATLERTNRLALRVRRTGPSKSMSIAAKHAWRTLQSDGEFRIYEHPLRAEPGAPAFGRMRVNELRDLLDYQPESAGSPTVLEFLETAERRLASGNILFTYAEEGRLLHCAWLIPSATRMGSEFGHDIPLTGNVSILWDDYTLSAARGRGLQQESLRARLSYAAAHKLSDRAMIGVRADNAPSRHNIEKLGFTYAGSAWISVRLGRTRRWITWEKRADSDNGDAPGTTETAETVEPRRTGLERI